MPCDILRKIHPNFPCVYGTIPLGSDTEQGIDDGHKFACGIKGSPILYSFGSCKDLTFELSFLRYRPDAKVFLFEIDPKNLPEESDRDPRISYNNVGLGGFPASWYVPLEKVQYLGSIGVVFPSTCICIYACLYG